jgi:hypothetical protein
MSKRFIAYRKAYARVISMHENAGQKPAKNLSSCKLATCQLALR